MDFDEYDYLEKMVDNPDLKKPEETSANGDRDNRKSEPKESSRSHSSKHRSNEKNGLDDGLRGSKRSKPEEDSRAGDRHKERTSYRPHSGSKDVEGRSTRDRGDSERIRDKEERKSRDADRGHDRQRERREGGKDSEKDGEKETEQPLQSRIRPERHQIDTLDKERAMNGDRVFRHRDRGREFRDGDRENRRKKDGGEEPVVDPERDQRTVFAYQITLKADERDVYEFFSRAGKVRDVRLIMDRNSRRSKGVGYIEFYDSMSVPMAIALSGQLLSGQPVMVKPSEAEKNLVQSTASTAGGLTNPYSGGARRLYVGNLNTNITEDQLRQVFEAFGTVELVQLPLDETGHCKGFGFVQFARLEDAKNALNLNGQLELAGRMIKVSTVTDHPELQEVGAIAGDLDDDDGGGLSLNARSRALLMQKLDRSGTAPSFTGSLATSVTGGIGLPTTHILGAASAIPNLAGLPGAGLQLTSAMVPAFDTIGTPSECLLLKNMFDPNAEMQPEFDLDIKEDVEEECSKYGRVKHAYVDKDSAGFVYVRFDTTESAMKAQNSMHGRWFAGKMITAAFMTLQDYDTKFPDNV